MGRVHQKAGLWGVSAQISGTAALTQPLVQLLTRVVVQAVVAQHVQHGPPQPLKVGQHSLQGRPSLSLASVRACTYSLGLHSGLRVGLQRADTTQWLLLLPRRTSPTDRVCTCSQGGAHVQPATSCNNVSECEWLHACKQVQGMHLQGLL